jgi:hypothetical protein
MTYTINELNGSGKRVVLTEGNGRDDAANVCHLLNKHCINKAERWTVKEETRVQEMKRWLKMIYPSIITGGKNV